VETNSTPMPPEPSRKDDESEPNRPTSSIKMNAHPLSESDLPIALTVQEAADLLRLDSRTVRAMVRTGELQGNQRGHAIRVSRSSVVDWLSGKRRAPRSKR